MHTSKSSLFYRHDTPKNPSVSSMIQDLNQAGFEKFDALATHYFASVQPQKISPVECLEDLLKTNFIVGEHHFAVSPKNFLIRNMPLLKESGFTTLFVEGLYYEHQKALDDYCLNPKCDTLDRELAQHLEGLNGANFPRYALYDLTDRWRENNYFALIQAAKQANIRIVGIDTIPTLQHAQKQLQSLDCDMKSRLKYMNFTASQIISEVTADNFSEDKWMLLTGAAHAKTFDKTIAGISDIFGAPCVGIEETDGLTLNQQIQYNICYQTQSLLSHAVPQNIIEKYPPVNLNLLVPCVNFEVYIRNNPFKEAPSISSLTMTTSYSNLENNPGLSETQFNKAMQNYIHYKNQFFGLPWLFTSNESRVAMYEIIMADNAQERLSIAKKYISTYPDKEFSNQLQNV